MNIKSYLILAIITLFFFPFNSFSQTYEDDTLAVRAILDSNELYTVRVKSVTDSSDGRIFYLDLEMFDLHTIPSEIGNLTYLKRLRLSENQLTELPTELGNLNNLEGLYLGTNRLTELPVEIGNLTNLRNLNLYKNRLTELPAELGNLCSLQVLNLRTNQFTELPVEIGNLTNLKWLIISNNQLITLLDSILGNLCSLQVLNLRTNQLTELPVEIGNLTNLKWLIISNNQLITLPDSIVKLLPSEACDFGYNMLDTNNLSDTVIAWLDKYDPDWRDTQNVPIIYNPNFNPLEFSINLTKSSIHFNLSNSGNTKLQIYNITGRLLTTLIDSYKETGSYTVNWDSKRYGSGTYYIKLSTGNNTLIQKTVLIR